MKAGLSRNVTYLGVVSGLTDISSEMLYPIVPVFLTSVLGAPMQVVGIIEGVAEATASFIKILGGRLSDKSGKRKPFVVAGYSLSAVAKPFCENTRLAQRFHTEGDLAKAMDAVIAKYRADGTLNTLVKQYFGQPVDFTHMPPDPTT